MCGAFSAWYRQVFSAADLQKYTEIEEGVPLEEVIAEMEEICRRFKATGGESWAALETRPAGSL
jgi:hypothetical protein